MKTNEDKLERLLKMTETPETFSDEELDDLFADEEMRTFYELMADSRRLYVLEEKPVCHQLPLRWMRYAALIVTGMLLIGGLAFAFHYWLRPHRSHPALLQAPVPAAAAAHPIDTLADVVTFEDIALEKILGDVGRHYRKTVVFGSSNLRAVRFFIEWKPAQPLQKMIDRLNSFDGIQVSIKGDSILVNQSGNVEE